MQQPPTAYIPRESIELQIHSTPGTGISPRRSSLNALTTTNLTARFTLTLDAGAGPLALRLEPYFGGLPLVEPPAPRSPRAPVPRREAPIGGWEDFLLNTEPPNPTNKRETYMSGDTLIAAEEGWATKGKDDAPDKEKNRVRWNGTAGSDAGGLSDADLDSLSGAYEGAGIAEDPYIVRFLDKDPTNPLNFSQAKKWTILMIAGTATFCVAFTSSLYVGGVTGMAATFGSSYEIVLLGLAFYVGGFGVGPMIWAPASELLGRRPIFIATFLPFFFFQIGCAVAKNTATMLICRLLAGTIGSSPLTNSAGVISDTFNATERGLAMGVYALMPFLGPVIGPIVGGFVGSAGKESWRNLFWISTAFSFVCLVSQSLVPETHAPVILRNRAKRLSHRNGKIYRSVYDLQAGADEQARMKIRSYMLRPFVLLFRELIVFLFALYASIIYGILYLMFGAYPVVFAADRGWSGGSSGLPFIAIGIGMLLGLVGTVFDSARYGRKMQAVGGPLPPEERLRICCIGGILLPISLAWFAASAKPSVHWIVPTLAGVPFGTGMLLVFLGGTSYLVDTYLSTAASAMAANSFMRSLFAAAFPLFTLKMFNGLGASWSLGLLAFVTLACTPIPFLFRIYGARIRARSPYAASNIGLGRTQTVAPLEQHPTPPSASYSSHNDSRDLSRVTTAHSGISAWEPRHSRDNFFDARSIIG